MFKWIKQLFGVKDAPPSIVVDNSYPYWLNTTNDSSPPIEAPTRSEPTSTTFFSSDYKIPEVETSEDYLEINPRILLKSYLPNPAYWSTWLASLRDHQVKAVNACTTPIGQINLPTGTGKTRVQTTLHLKGMLENPGIYVIAAHRLVLCQQLLNEILDVALNTGVKLNVLFVGSDRVDEAELHKTYRNLGVTKDVLEVRSSLSTDEITDFSNQTLKEGKSLLCVSTYHSFDKLKNLRIKLATFDEAHTIVTKTENFLSNIQEVENIERKYFFTATRRVIGDSDGMNDESIYGKVLYEASPREMIEAGEIVPPKLHRIKPTEEGDFTNTKMLVKSICDGFTQHNAELQKVSARPHNIQAKLLVSTSGNEDLTDILNSPEFLRYCLEEGINVFSFSSANGYHRLGKENFEQVPRTQLIAEMKSLQDDERAILLHIDILTEGIDLPSITGVMPFRELNTIKLLQTIGRASRLLGQDRKNLYLGKFPPMDWECYTKPFSYVLIPEFYESLGSKDRLKKILTSVFNEYKVPVEDYIIPDRYLAYNDPELESIIEGNNKKASGKECDLDHLIVDLIMDRLEEVKETPEFTKALMDLANEEHAIM